MGINPLLHSEINIALCGIGRLQREYFFTKAQLIYSVRKLFGNNTE